MGNIKNEIKSYIVASGWSLVDIAKELNEKYGAKGTTPQNLSNKLSRGSMRYNEVKMIAKIIGYQIKWEKEINKWGER